MTYLRFNTATDAAVYASRYGVQWDLYYGEPCDPQGLIDFAQCLDQENPLTEEGCWYTAADDGSFGMTLDYGEHVQPLATVAIPIPPEERMEIAETPAMVIESEVKEKVQGLSKLLTFKGLAVKALMCGLALLAVWIVTMLWQHICATHGWGTPFIAKVLAYLTFANGGVSTNLFFMLGGILGKMFVMATLMAVVIGGFKKVGQGWGRFVKCTTSLGSLKDFRLYVAGVGVACVLYNFFTGYAPMRLSMVGFAGALSMLWALGGGVHLIRRLTVALTAYVNPQSRVHYVDLPSAERALSGAALGFVVSVVLSLLPWGFMPYLVGVYCAIVAVVLTVLDKSDSVSMPGATRAFTLLAMLAVAASAFALEGNVPLKVDKDQRQGLWQKFRVYDKKDYIYDRSADSATEMVYDIWAYGPDRRFQIVDKFGQTRGAWVDWEKGEYIVKVDAFDPQTKAQRIAFRLGRAELLQELDTSKPQVERTPEPEERVTSQPEVTTREPEPVRPREPEAVDNRQPEPTGSFIVPHEETEGGGDNGASEGIPPGAMAVIIIGSGAGGILVILVSLIGAGGAGDGGAGGPYTPQPPRPSDPYVWRGPDGTVNYVNPITGERDYLPPDTDEGALRQQVEHVLDNREYYERIQGQHNRWTEQQRRQLAEEAARRNAEWERRQAEKRAQEEALRKQQEAEIQRRQEYIDRLIEKHWAGGEEFLRRNIIRDMGWDEARYYDYMATAHGAEAAYHAVNGVKNLADVSMDMAAAAGDATGNKIPGIIRDVYKAGTEMTYTMVDAKLRGLDMKEAAIAGTTRATITFIQYKTGAKGGWKHLASTVGGEAVRDATTAWQQGKSWSEIGWSAVKGGLRGAENYGVDTTTGKLGEKLGGYANSADGKRAANELGAVSDDLGKIAGDDYVNNATGNT